MTPSWGRPICTSSQPPACPAMKPPSHWRIAYQATGTAGANPTATIFCVRF
jgi:hypothetical protein